MYFLLLPEASFPVEPTMLTEIGQRNKVLLSQLKRELAQLKLEVWPTITPIVEPTTLSVVGTKHEISKSVIQLSNSFYA